MSLEDTALPENFRRAVNLKLRNDLHMARRIWHMVGVTVILVIFHNTDRATALLASSLAVAIIVPIDFIRVKSRFANRLAFRVFGPFLRKTEIKKLSGISYMICGVLLVILLFPRQVATLSLFMLAAGDPICSMAGVLWGKDKLIGNKTLQGSMAGFIACTIVALAFYSTRGIMTDRLILVSLLSGAAGSISELIPIGNLDDNFSFPLICATLLFGIFSLFGGFL